MNNFDPMTGEPINGSATNNATENIVENTVENAPENVAENIADNGDETVAADNATVEKVVLEKAAQPVEDKIIGYDPMTGEPIRESAQQAQPEMNFDPMTGRPITPGTPIGNPGGGNTNSSSGKANKVKVPVIIGAVVLVVVVGLVAIFSGVFSSKATKVMTAVAGTFKEPSKMMKAIEGFNVLTEDSYTVNMEMDVEGDYVEFAYASNKDEKQVSGIIDVDDVPEIEFLAALTDSQLKVQAPDFSDYVFVYDYKKEKDGYLADEMGDEVIEALDMLCDMFYSQKSQTEASDEIAKIVMDAIKELEFETVDKEEYEVNGKDRNCKGYKTEVTEDLFLDIIDALEDSIDPEYVEMMEELDVDIEDMYEDMRDEIKGMDDMELTFYIYKNKLACLLVEIDKKELEIMFTDCEKGMHDIEICLEGDTIMEIDGSVDGSTETYEVEMDGKEFMYLEYDSKSGDYEIEITESYSSLAMEGNLKSDSKGTTFSIDEMEENGRTYDMTCTVSVKKGAKMQKFDGDEFDIGNASEDEVMDVVLDMYSEILGTTSQEVAPATEDIW